jgi:hypothetical protein
MFRCPGEVSGGAQVGQELLSDGAHQSQRISTERIAGGANDRRARSRGHLEEDLPRILAGEGVLRKIVEEGAQRAGKRKTGSSELLDQLARQLDLGTETTHLDHAR